MAEGARVGTAHVTIEPDVHAAAFAAEGRVASQLFNDSFMGQMGDDLRRLSGQFRQQGDQIGSSLSGGISGGLRAVSDAMHSISGSMTSVGFALQNVGSQGVYLGHTLSAFVTGPLAIAAAGLSAWGVKTGMNLETARVGLGALLPPGYDVEGLMNRLVKLATSSPVFAIDQVTQFTRKLVGAGVEASRAETMLDAINKIFITYGVTGESAGKALLGISQVFSKGKVQSEELTGQIGEQIPIWHLLSQASGKSQQELMALAKTGKFTSDTFGDMLINVGQLPSVTAGAAKGVSTLSAQLQMMKESTQTILGVAFEKNFDRIKASIERLKPALDIFISWFVDQIPRALEWVNTLASRIEALALWWQELDPKMQSVVLKMVGLAAAAGPVLSILGTMTSALGGLFAAMGFLLSPWGIVLGAIAGALVLIAKHLYDVWKAGGDVGGRLQGIVDTVKVGWNQYLLPALSIMWEWFEQKIIPVVIRFVDLLIKNLVPAFKQIWESIKASLLPALDKLMQTIGHENIAKFFEWLMVRLPVALGRFVAGVAVAIEFVSLLIDGVSFIIQGFKDLERTLDGWTDTVKRSFQEAKGEWQGFSEFVGVVWQNAMNGAKNAWDFIRNGINWLVSSVRDDFSWMRDTIAGIWNSFVYVARGAWEFVRNGINWLVQSIRDDFNWIGGIIGGAWDWIGARIQGVSNWIMSVVDWLVGSMRNAFQWVSNSISSIWDGLGNRVKDIVNWIVDGINFMIHGFNKVIDLANQIPGVRVGFYISPLGKWAQGGLIDGPGSATSDSIPAMLSRGEFVMRASAVKQFGSSFFTQLNQGRMPIAAPISLGAMGGSRSDISAMPINLTINNNIDGEVITHRAQAVVDANNRATVSTLRAGRRLG